MKGPRGALIRMQLATERAWGKDPGWLSTLPVEVADLLMAELSHEVPRKD